MARLVLETPLPSEECFRRLEAATDAWPLIPERNLSETPMAKLSPPRFKLKRHEYYFFSAFREIFHGRIVEQAGTTRIYGRVGLSIATLLLFSMAIAFPAALQTYSLEWFPGPNQFELRFPLYWLVTLLILKLVGAWDSGGPEDEFSRFLSVTLIDSDSLRPLPSSRSA